MYSQSIEETKSITMGHEHLDKGMVDEPHPKSPRQLIKSIPACPTGVAFEAVEDFLKILRGLEMIGRCPSRGLSAATDRYDKEIRMHLSVDWFQPNIDEHTSTPAVVFIPIPNLAPSLRRRSNIVSERLAVNSVGNVRSSLFKRLPLLQVSSAHSANITSSFPSGREQIISLDTSFSAALHDMKAVDWHAELELGSLHATRTFRDDDLTSTIKAFISMERSQGSEQCPVLSRRFLQLDFDHSLCFHPLSITVVSTKFYYHTARALNPGLLPAGCLLENFERYKIICSRCRLLIKPV